MAVIDELDDVIRLLESKIPANPNSIQNEKLARSLEKSMAEYFRNLEMAFPYEEIETLYYKLAKQE
jgi:hypothetical protein